MALISSQDAIKYPSYFFFLVNRFSKNKWIVVVFFTDFFKTIKVDETIFLENFCINSKKLWPCKNLKIYLHFLINQINLKNNQFENWISENTKMGDIFRSNVTFSWREGIHFYVTTFLALPSTAFVAQSVRASV